MQFEEGRQIPVLVRLGVNIEVLGFTACLYPLEARVTMRYQGGVFVEPFGVESIVVPPDAFPYG